jgi:LysM repeat protein
VTGACVISPPPGWALYTVQQGDALARLAFNANVTVATVMQVNCLTSDLLSVGKQLWLPGPSGTATPTRAPGATVAPAPTSGGGGGGGGGQPTSAPPTNTPEPEQPTDTPEPEPPTKTPPPSP